MLIPLEQMKYLIVDGEETYKFIGQELATDEEKQSLKELDESSVFINGQHLITNYNEID